MSRSTSPSSYPSSYSFAAYSLQFVELCRTQLILLRNLGAERGIIYTTQMTIEGQEPKLEPLVSYPNENTGQEEVSISKLLSGTIEDPSAILSDMVVPNLNLSRLNQQQPVQKWPPQKLLQPLVHEGTIIGLLWVVRVDRPWQEPERHQIEQISHVVSLAAIIDQERQWAIQTLEKQQKIQSRQQKLFDNLLHQLRNPLTAIYTFGKLLVKKIPAEDANQRIALNILRESEHLKELMQQLDNFTGTRQLEAGTNLFLPVGKMTSPDNSEQNVSGTESLPLLPPASLQLQPCSLSEILEPILANAAVVAQEKQLLFLSQIPADLAPVLASASALREVLGNLVDNALKYTLQGTVQVTVLADEQHSSIVITDSGVGIPAEDLPHLFQRSYRGVQASGNISGTGLGLSIVKELLEQMGGKIQIVSPVSFDSQGKGLGSKFTVLLPITRETISNISSGAQVN
jgi:signal transduction histidine kinase